MEVLELLAQKGELRYGQLIWNALCKAGWIEAPDGNCLFYIEDSKLAEILEKFLEGTK